MLYLGIDFGLKRVGLAISEGTLASPLTVLQGNGFENLSKQVIDLAKTKSPDLIVVGMADQGMGKLSKKLIVNLKKAGFKVEEINENLSSKNALDRMITLGIGKKKRQTDDAYSATEILQSYLDEKDR